jgi:hypothetical protein
LSGLTFSTSRRSSDCRDGHGKYCYDCGGGDNHSCDGDDDNGGGGHIVVKVSKNFSQEGYTLTENLAAILARSLIRVCL